VVLKTYSELGETEADFRVRLAQMAREERDRRIAAVQRKYQSRMERLKSQLRRARERVEREKAQYRQKTMDTVVTAGSAVWRLLFGRRGSRGTTVARKATMAARERGDIRRAEENMEEVARKIETLESQVDEELDRIRAAWHPDELALERCPLRPRKSDIAIVSYGLAWTPWWRAPDGRLRRAW